MVWKVRLSGRSAPLLERAVEMGLWIRVSEKVIGGLKTNE